MRSSKSLAPTRCASTRCSWALWTRRRCGIPMPSAAAVASSPAFTIWSFPTKLTEEESPRGPQARPPPRRMASQRDIEALQFNTAIAKMMEFMNDFHQACPPIHAPSSRWSTQALMPFAPHLAEEVWQVLGCKEELAHAPLPRN